MTKQLWVPKPGPTIWDKIKCYFGLHEYNAPTEETDCSGHFECHGQCGSYMVWDSGIPIFGKCFLLGKPQSYKIKVTYLEKP